MSKEISDDLVVKLKEWIGEDGLNFFQKCLDEEGTVAPVLVTGGIPHPVHFREGMQIRNFMRSSGLCDDWNAHDYDNNWMSVVEKALKWKEDEKIPGVKW